MRARKIQICIYLNIRVSRKESTNAVNQNKLKSTADISDLD